MANKKNENLPRWVTYLIPIVLGLGLAVSIFLGVWNKSMHSSIQKFILDSVSYKENITHNLISSENLLKNIQNILLFSEENIRPIDNMMDNVYSHSPYIAGIQIQKLNSNLINDEQSQINISSLEHIKIKYQSFRPEDDEISLHDLISPLDYTTSIKPLLQGNIFSIFSPKNKINNRYFIIFSLLPEKKLSDEYTISALIINKNQFFRDISTTKNILVSVDSESSGLSGRQNLYQNSINQDRWAIKTINNKQSFHLSSYSLKFEFVKPLHITELDMPLLGSSIIVGLGITLLAIALVRSRELQAEELQRRAEVIQKKVDEQTKILASARDSAVDASRIKSEFLASMSHEIRTPLNAIIGISELMAETELNTEQSKYVKIFRKAGDNLLSLVNDILDLSKIEAEQLILEEIPFNLIELVEESVDIYAIKATEKNIQLTGRVEPKTEINRVGDPTRLRQIILNLISNALKFTTEGTVALSVTPSKEPGEEEYLIFSVTDSGIGIPKEKLESIFSSFTQVDSSTTRKYGGTGLGLTISKSLVHMMGGQMNVESVEGKGSTFSFKVQLEFAEIVPAITGSFPIINLKKQKILIVDDNSTNRLILKDTLEMMQAECVEVESGQSALVNLRQKNDFTLYLLDYEMPGMDGIELAEKFRDELNIDLSKVIMISSAIYGLENKKIKELNLGAYVHKPIKRVELLRQISFILYQENELENDAKSIKEKVEPVVDDKIYDILLVEDNEDNRLLVKLFLRNKNYTLHEAVNGQVGLDMFMNNNYDLVLMDVQMPVMDGHEATRQMRIWETSNSLPHTPIIALTAHAIREEIDKCIEAGCDTHLGKPIKKLTLTATLEKYLQNNVENVT